jgi:hypothetical protein
MVRERRAAKVRKHFMRSIIGDISPFLCVSFAKAEKIFWSERRGCSQHSLP